MYKWERFFREHGNDQPMAFGYPEEGARNVGSIEELYEAFRGRLLHELTLSTDDDGAPTIELASWISEG